MKTQPVSPVSAKKAVAKTFRFIGEKRPVVKSTKPLPDDAFFRDLGQRIDKKLEERAEQEMQRRRAMIQAGAEYRRITI